MLSHDKKRMDWHVEAMSRAAVPGSMDRLEQVARVSQSTRLSEACMVTQAGVDKPMRRNERCCLHLVAKEIDRKLSDFSLLSQAKTFPHASQWYGLWQQCRHLPEGVDMVVGVSKQHLQGHVLDASPETLDNLCARLSCLHCSQTAQKHLQTLQNINA